MSGRRYPSIIGVRDFSLSLFRHFRCCWGPDNAGGRSVLQALPVLCFPCETLLGVGAAASSKERLVRARERRGRREAAPFLKSKGKQRLAS